MFMFWCLSDAVNGPIFDPVMILFVAIALGVMIIGGAAAVFLVCKYKNSGPDSDTEDRKSAIAYQHV